jgi:hypothetical protein
LKSIHRCFTAAYYRKARLPLPPELANTSEATDFLPRLYTDAAVDFVDGPLPAALSDLKARVTFLCWPKEK